MAQKLNLLNNRSCADAVDHEPGQVETSDKLRMQQMARRILATTERAWASEIALQRGTRAKSNRSAGEWLWRDSPPVPDPQCWVLGALAGV